MSLRINDEYFGDLLPYIKNESITDITWNGRDLWLDDLKRGRYRSQLKLSDQFVSTFATRIANLANKNFNLSEPLLEAETDDLRISIIDGTVTNTNRSIAIRKTPAVRRLNEIKMMEDGYAEAMVLKLLEALVKGHSSIIVTGDVGSGKTELIKYLTKFIPPYERTISIEDNYELRLSAINPNLDCVEIKAAQEGEGPFSYQNAIKAALRQLCKWLLMAEARSKEVINLLEAASTGCIVMTTLHSDDVRKIPDRVVNMMGIDGEEKRNDVYNFFDVGIKVGIIKTDRGIKRSIDQICVLDRDDNENSIYLIYNHGFTGQTLPRNLWQKVVEGAKDEISLFEFLKPDNADSYDLIETPEFAQMVEHLEDSMREGLITEYENESSGRYDTPDIENVNDVIGLFDEIPEEEHEEVFDIDEMGDILDKIVEEKPEEEPPVEPIVEAATETPEVEVPPVVESTENYDQYYEDINKDKDDLIDLGLLLDQLQETEAPEPDAFSAEPEEIPSEPEKTPAELPENIGNVLGLFDQLPIFEEYGQEAFKGINFEKLEGLSGHELIYELKKQLTINWLNSLSEEELVKEMKREIEIGEQCRKTGTPIPEHELIKMHANIERN